MRAKAKITQASTVGDGTAIVGDTAADVIWENSDNTGVDEWQFTLVSAPTGFSVTPGVVQAWSGIQTWRITAAQLSGFNGSWFVEIAVRNLTTREIRRSTVKYNDQAGSGEGGVFSIPNANGLIKIAHAAMGRHMNIAGNERAWTSQIDDVMDNAGGGGGGAVADDIAKSAGSSIDRVRGIRGVAIVGADGAPSDIGASLVYDESGTPGYKRYRAAPWINVKSFGADETGVADSSPMFKLAHDAILGANAKGGTLFMPEGDFRLDESFVLAKNVTLLGSGMTSGNGGTWLHFAAGKKIVAAGFAGGQKYPTPSTAQGSRILNFGIIKDEDARIADTARAASSHVTVGTKRVYQAGAGELDDQRHVYLECIVEGDTGSGTLAVPAHPDEFSEAFVPSGTYYLGQLVRGTTDGNPPNATGSNLITGYLFKVIVEGVAASSAPTWNTPGTTTSGTVTFLAISSADFWVTDGTAVWAAKSDAGILAFCKIRMEDLHIEGAGGPGVHLRGNSNGGVATNCNGWTASNLRIVHCGIGFMPHGGDAQAGVGSMIDVEGAGYKMPAGGGIGIYDASGVGNLWLGCQVANVPSSSFYDPNGGGSHSYMTAESGLMAACFVNCYSEGYGGLYGSPIANHLPGINTVVYGGAHSAGFTDSLYTAANGKKTEARFDLDPGQGASKAGVWRTTMSWGSLQDKGGSGASVTEQTVGYNNARNPVNGTIRVTGLLGVTSDDAGRYLTLSGATTYNGTFAISSISTNTSTGTFTFAEVGAVGDTITRSVGSWIADGHVAGSYINCSGTSSNNFTGALVTNVTATVLTLDTQDLVAETSTATITSVDIYAVDRTHTSSTAQDASNGSITWVISGGYVTSYMGTRDGNGAVIQWAAHDYGAVDKYHLCHSGVLTDGGGWPGKDWWVITSQGLKERICLALPGLNATYGADQFGVDAFGIHIPGKLWFGNPANYLPSIDYGTAAPTGSRQGKGSVRFNQNWDGAKGTPIAWMCSVTGSPGTWTPLYVGAVEIPSGKNIVTMPSDADYTVPSASVDPYEFVQINGTLTTTRTITFPAPADNSKARSWDIFNNTSQIVGFTTGTGSTSYMNAGSKGRLNFSAEGVISIASYQNP